VQSDLGQFTGFEQRSLDTLAGEYQQLRSDIRDTLLDIGKNWRKLEGDKGTDYVSEVIRQIHVILASNRQFGEDIMKVNASYKISESQVKVLKRSLVNLEGRLKKLKKTLNVES
jgi:hypothetical protein